MDSTQLGVSTRTASHHGADQIAAYRLPPTLPTFTANIRAEAARPEPFRTDLETEALPREPAHDKPLVVLSPQRVKGIEHEQIQEAVAYHASASVGCSLLTQRQHLLSLPMGLGLLIQQVGDVLDNKMS